MMFTSYATSRFDLNIAKDAGLLEIILAPKELNRFSKNNFTEFVDLCKFAKDLNLKVLLEWDILINECDFDTAVQAFKKIPTELYDSVRVQDVGVLEFVLQESSKKIQVIVETGNHNLTGLKKWESYVGDRLERLILSNELSKDLLEIYKKELACPLEILVLGRILLFYSPRKLLDPLLETSKDMKSEYLEALGESEESPHKGFPVIQNKHGSFMFHIKDLFLLDKLDEIKSLSVDHLRIDLRWNEIELLREITKLKSSSDSLELKKTYGVEVIRGYFQINKSDVLFKKLKNSRLQRKDISYIGEVLEARKSEFMALHLKGEVSLKLGDTLKFITPEGREHFCKVHVLKNLEFDDKEAIRSGELALINYMSGVWTKSQVYLDHPKN